MQKEKITKSAALRPSKAFFFFFSHITSTKEKTKTKKAGYSSARKISSKARSYYAGTLHNKHEPAGLIARERVNTPTFRAQLPGEFPKLPYSSRYLCEILRVCDFNARLVYFIRPEP